MDVVSADATACDCLDLVVRGGPCRYILAVRLRWGDGEAVEALRAVVAPPQRRRARA